jgi:predicted lipoprotein with Yx(FWY)xxD motif
MTRLAAFVAAIAAVAAAAVLVVIVATRSAAGEGAPPSHGRQKRRCARCSHAARTHSRRRRGHALYLFVQDRHGRNACGAGCARVWPPLVASGRPRLGTGVKRTKLTTTRRADGRQQLVYNGHPLYALVADTRPGQVQGQGFLGAWYAVSPAGHQVGGRGGSSRPSY